MNPFVPEDTKKNLDSSSDRHCLSSYLHDENSKFVGEANPKTMKKLLLESDCNIPLSRVKDQPEGKKDIQVVSVELEGLDRSESETSIKTKLREHKHIVSIKPKMDFLSGQCKGSAKVTVRLGAGED